MRQYPCNYSPNLSGKLFKKLNTSHLQKGSVSIIIQKVQISLFKCNHMAWLSICGVNNHETVRVAIKILSMKTKNTKIDRRWSYQWHRHSLTNDSPAGTAQITWWGMKPVLFSLPIRIVSKVCFSPYVRTHFWQMYILNGRILKRIRIVIIGNNLHCAPGRYISLQQEVDA